MTVVELRPERVVAGGAALARATDGRVVFVDGALPGEVVRAELHDERRDFARATTVSVLVASPARVAEPCPQRARGCGGCDWQFVDPAAQIGFKADIVRDALVRLGRLDSPVVRIGGAVPASAYRTTVRVAIDRDGRAGFRARATHEVVTADSCLVAHPLVESAVAALRARGATEVTVRVSAATGQMTAIADPSTARIEGLAHAVATGPSAAIDEVVAGARIRVSAPSFFQSGPAAAELIVATVGGAVADVAGAVAVDAYGGVGLFAVTALGAASDLTLIEASAPACDDARHNLGDRARVVHGPVERWRPSRADVVVADPARSGLGRAAAERLAATGAERLVLVSCDAAALGRDARLLIDLGYDLGDVTVLDVFPHTHHVEAVAAFTRSGRAGAPPTLSAPSSRRDGRRAGASHRASRRR